MGMNAIEKILAKRSGQAIVKPGDVVVVDVDTAVSFDAGKPFIKKIHNPDMLVLLHERHQEPHQYLLHRLVQFHKKLCQ